MIAEETEDKRFLDAQNLFLSKCGYWVELETLLSPSNEKYNIQIILENDSITKPYLVFINNDLASSNSNVNNSAIEAIFPITSEISLLFNSNQGVLIFNNYKRKLLRFTIDQKNENRKFEIFVSQFSILSQTSNLTLKSDEYLIQNGSFLAKHVILEDALIENQLLDSKDVPTCVFPVVFDDRAKKTWKRRNKQLNDGKYPKPEVIKISCLTWNVGGGHPASYPQVVEDLSKIARNDSDIYFFTFEEIDMSFSAISTGKSPNAAEWKSCIKKAFLCEQDVSVPKIKLKRHIKNDSSLDLHDLEKKPKKHHKKMRKIKVPKKGHKGNQFNSVELSPNPRPNIKNFDNVYSCQLNGAEIQDFNSLDLKFRSCSFDSMAAMNLLIGKISHGQPRIPSSNSSLLDSSFHMPKSITTGSLSDTNIHDDSTLLTSNVVSKYDVISESQSNAKLFTKMGHKLIKTSYLGGVFVAIVVKEELPVPVMFNKPKKKRFGYHQMACNKSAIIIPATIGDFVHMCFVGCHLSANPIKTHKRDKQLKYLLKKCIFDVNWLNNSSNDLATNDYSSSDDSNDFLSDGDDENESIYQDDLNQNSENSSNEESNESSESNDIVLPPKSHLGNHVDFLVLMGDLNYRVEMDYEECIHHMKNHDIDSILKHDQLNRVKTTDKSLALYDECPITFMPTYKYDKRSNSYDSSEKKRVPSYTDRILVVTNDESVSEPVKPTRNDNAKFKFETDVVHRMFQDKIEYIERNSDISEIIGPSSLSKPKYLYYDRLENQFSDHRPVTCGLKFNIPTSAPCELLSFYKCQEKRLCNMILLAAPMIEPQTLSLQVSSENPTTISFANVSLAWAYWHLMIDKTNYENSEMQEMLSVTPSNGIIFPNQSEEIRFERKKTAKKEEIKSFIITIASLDNSQLASLKIEM